MALNKVKDIALDSEKIGNLLDYPILTTETGVVNVKYPYGDIRRYGGKNNNLTGNETFDNTSALQLVIDNAENIFGYGIIPNGLFKCTGTVYINRQRAITLYGQGSQLWFNVGSIIQKTTTGDLFRINLDASLGQAYANAVYTTFKGLKFMGVSGNQTTAINGFHMRLRVLECNFENVYRGIDDPITDSHGNVSYSDFWHIEDINLGGIADGFMMMYLGDTSVIRGIRLDGDAAQNASMTYLIHCKGGRSIDISHITCNWLPATANAMIYLEVSVGVSIKNIYCEDNLCPIIKTVDVNNLKIDTSVFTNFRNHVASAACDTVSISGGYGVEINNVVFRIDHASGMDINCSADKVRINNLQVQTLNAGMNGWDQRAGIYWFNNKDYQVSTDNSIFFRAVYNTSWQLVDRTGNDITSLIASSVVFSGTALTITLKNVSKIMQAELMGAKSLYRPTLEQITDTTIKINFLNTSSVFVTVPDIQCGCYVKASLLY